jgi:ATP-dependent protease ClpP protease subunit
MAKADIQELFEIEPEECGGAFITTTKQEIFSHLVKFDENIGPPAKYRGLIDLLYLADENAVFNFFINSSGGGLSAAMAIIEGIKGSDALVRAIITGECHSAASLIALNCHEIVVTDSAHALIHTASYGTGGNTHMVQGHVDFSTKMINKMLEKTYSGFLSDSEIGDVKRGIEIWFDADQIRERLLTRNDYLAVKKVDATPPAKKTTKPRSKAQ